MPIVAYEYLMSLTVLSANIKCRAVPIVADRADFVRGPQLQNRMKHELQTFTVTLSLRDVSEFVKIVCILEPYLAFAILRNNRYCATYGHLHYGLPSKGKLSQCKIVATSGETIPAIVTNIKNS